jgi:hypothetical protein
MNPVIMVMVRLWLYEPWPWPQQLAEVSEIEKHAKEVMAASVQQTLSDGHE